ncbi:hypothetical protein IWZ00DRAFT_373169 [Phyllosticta capitalensis]
MSDVCLCLLSVANCRQSVCRSLLSAGRRVPGQAGLGAGPRFVLHWRRMARDTRQRRTDDASLRTKNCTAVEVESRRWVMMSKAGCRWVAPKKWTWRRRAGFKRCRCKSKVLSRSREEVKVATAFHDPFAVSAKKVSSRPFRLSSVIPLWSAGLWLATVERIHKKGVAGPVYSCLLAIFISPVYLPLLTLFPVVDSLVSSAADSCSRLGCRLLPSLD